jgi:phosphoribosyl-ATP pyrophosphohydrolase/phosphoribosyl-AMP cyclohydrolase
MKVPSTIDPAKLNYDQQGLLPVVVQDEQSGAVLMVAWANREAVEKTLETGFAHFYSRSRKELWRKGETSGNTLEVRHVLHDCDQDTLLIRARPAGPACHLGTRTCFEPNDSVLELGWLWRILTEREGADKKESYTRRLLDSGVDRIARKIGEEASETIIAAIRLDAERERVDSGLGDNDQRQKLAADLVSESCDLLYHLLVLLRSLDVQPAAMRSELLQRHDARIAATEIESDVHRRTGGGA